MNSNLKKPVFKIVFKFKSFHYFNFEIILTKILKKLEIFGIPQQNFVSLPTTVEKFTVLRSPHVDKKSREQFEIRTYSKSLTLFFYSKNFVEKQKIKLLINFIKNSTAGFDLKIVYST
jgi:small subunit ribosomal protein S10